MNIEFDWDPDKATSNARIHGVSFIEAVSIFFDPLSLTVLDLLHSIHEHRYLTIGLSSDHRLLVVVHTQRGDRIRLISARLATRFERQEYESETR